MHSFSRSNSVSSLSSLSSDIEVDTMQIFVKNIAGETLTMTVPTSTTVSTLRHLVGLRTNLPSDDLRLIHAGKQLSSRSSDSTLSECSISQNSTIHLAMPLRGGVAKKLRCTFKDCKDAAQRIVGDCGFCSGHFCGKHRLLEDHKCSGLEDCKRESHQQNADKLNSERTVAIKGI